jgi:hypothetical protein
MADAASFDNLHWYAVQTKPKQETRAEANLHRWGLETLLPRLREVRDAVRVFYGTGLDVLLIGNFILQK